MNIQNKIFFRGIVPFIITERMEESFGARAKGLFCIIREKYKNDEGLIQHELTHIKWQWIFLLIPYAILYKLVPKFRLWMEVIGYRVQSKYEPNINLLAYRLANSYDLDITQAEALKLLKMGGK